MQNHGAKYTLLTVHLIFQSCRLFFNQVLAQTWEDKGRSVDSLKIAKNTRNYPVGIFPDELSKKDGNGPIILLTCAVDLNGKTDDARLDYEVIGWTKNLTTYSVDHGSMGNFQRSSAMRAAEAKDHAKREEERVRYTYRENQTNNVWDIFENDVLNRIWTSEGKRKTKITFTGIDVGHFTKHAKSFVAKNLLRCGLKGRDESKFTSLEMKKKYYVKSEDQANLYHVLGTHVKDDLADNMELEWNEESGVEQPAGFMNFPEPSQGKYTIKSYFREYEGEERKVELSNDNKVVGARWVKKHSSSINHFLDCRVYNMVMQKIATELLCKRMKIEVSWDLLCNYLLKKL